MRNVSITNAEMIIRHKPTCDCATSIMTALIITFFCLALRAKKHNDFKIALNDLQNHNEFTSVQFCGFDLNT